MSLEYLEEERVKLWNKVLELERDIAKKTSDYEKEAKQSSKKASEYRNRSDEARDVAHKNADESKKKLESINEIQESVISYNDSIHNYFVKSKETNENLNEIFDEITNKKSTLDAQITQLEEYFEDESYYVKKLETQNSYFEQGEEINTKIEALYKSILNRKKEIDKVQIEIFGYDETIEDENGEEIENHIDGLKDTLENSFDKIDDDLKELKNEVSTVKNETIIGYQDFINESKINFNNQLKSWNSEYDSKLKKIEELLPNALTTGLSYAYSEKKKSEELDSVKLAKKFKTATYGLVAVSLIPFLISIISLSDGKTLEEVIITIPRLVLAILPLYIPVLWLAYSSNKKLNLSKRLIEEYTHKEVLSKTFEGLSTQIENIDNLDISNELQTKLLYNILSVSSENPGKLISDYNKSDHPLMDTLEKSVKLADAVENLSKIPGFSSLASKLSKKAESIIDSQKEKISKGLNSIVENEEDEH